MFCDDSNEQQNITHPRRPWTSRTPGLFVTSLSEIGEFQCEKWVQRVALALVTWKQLYIHNIKFQYRRTNTISRKFLLGNVWTSALDLSPCNYHMFGPLKGIRRAEVQEGGKFVCNWLHIAPLLFIIRALKAFQFACKKVENALEHTRPVFFPLSLS